MSPMDGMIQGGWEYVGAAWGISLTLLAAFAVFVNVQLARAERGGGAP